MGTRRLSQIALAGAALVVMMLAPARGGEPSAQELIALAPVLDSSDWRCRSLDIGGHIGDKKDPASPGLRFRALYRAPNQFSLLLSDAVDGTPLVFCSGKKMFVYDPVGPTVYYSEDASFILEMACTKTEWKFNYTVWLKSKKPHHILVDFRSLLSGAGRAVGGESYEDRVVKYDTGELGLISSFKNQPCLSLKVDLTKDCPYTSFALHQDGATLLSFDRLVLNGEPGDEPFAFPAKRRLTRRLSVVDVTADENMAVMRNGMAMACRASVVRSVVNKAERPEALRIPGLSDLDWDRVRANDKTYAKALRDLVPPSLRTR